MIQMLVLRFTLHCVDAIEVKDLIDFFPALCWCIITEQPPPLGAPQVQIKNAKVSGISEEVFTY
jgi:hypothetical protein